MLRFLRRMFRLPDSPAPHVDEVAFRMLRSIRRAQRRYPEDPELARQYQRMVAVIRGTEAKR